MVAHSNYSFSSSSRWLKDRCSASVRVQRNKPSTTNDAAELGTAAHECGEFCIMWGIEPSECIGMVFNNIVVDTAMVDAVEIYVGHVMANRPNAMLEKKVTLRINGRDDVYGTSDCTTFVGRTLYVDDYKHGYGVVEVKDNTQLICYAVATLDTFNAWFKVDKIVVTIIQPRANHVHGAIRSHTYTVDELLEWRGFIVSSIHTADDPDVKPVAGEWCKYCLAAPTCKARLIRTIDLTFDDEPVTDETLISLYPEIKVIQNHLDAVASKVSELAKSGKGIEGYKLVKQRKRAKINDEQALIVECNSAGIDTDNLYEKKLKSKTNLIKVAGETIVNRHFEVGEAGLELVKLNDNRPAVSMKKSAVNIFNGVK